VGSAHRGSLLHRASEDRILTEKFPEMLLVHDIEVVTEDVVDVEVLL
jgi:hypothetical protein